MSLPEVINIIPKYLIWAALIKEPSRMVKNRRRMPLSQFVWRRIDERRFTANVAPVWIRKILDIKSFAMPGFHHWPSATAFICHTATLWYICAWVLTLNVQLSNNRAGCVGKLRPLPILLFEGNLQFLFCTDSMEYWSFWVWSKCSSPFCKLFVFIDR